MQYNNTVNKGQTMAKGSTTERRVEPTIGLNTMSVSELADAIKNSALKRLAVVQNEAGRFELVINLTWKAGDWHIESYRGAARGWSSLDRLVGHIQNTQKKHGGTLPEITITLNRRIVQTDEPAEKKGKTLLSSEKTKRPRKPPE